MCNCNKEYSNNRRPIFNCCCCCCCECRREPKKNDCGCGRTFGQSNGQSFEQSNSQSFGYEQDEY